MKTIVVLNNIPALKQAIRLKQEGKIEKLIAGPNLVHFPNEHDRLLASPSIDIVLVPSEPVRIIYEQEAHDLKNRLKIWPAGVDENYWQPPVRRLEEKNSVVYLKNEPEEFCVDVEKVLQKHGWKTVRVTYGAYKPEDFKRTLARSRLAVFISRNESQGIALAEAWAMDIPTLVWDSGKPYSILGRQLPTSPAPYLTADTGRKWRTLDELSILLLKFDSLEFKPRRWVLANMTDMVIAKKLIEIINS